MNKQPEITDATRQAFIDALCQLGQSKPIEKITIIELTRRAGYNRCTFYQYFKDIYELLDFVESRLITQVKDNFRSQISIENFGATFIKAFSKLNEDQAQYVELLFSSSNSSRFIKRFIAEITPVFQEKFQLPAHDLHSRYLTELYFYTVIGAISSWLSNNRDLSLNELSQLVQNVLTSGAFTQILKKSAETTPRP